MFNTFMTRLSLLKEVKWEQISRMMGDYVAVEAPQDLVQEIRDHVDPRILELLEDHYAGEFFICGGAVRSYYSKGVPRLEDSLKDIDIYVSPMNIRRIYKDLEDLQIYSVGTMHNLVHTYRFNIPLQIIGMHPANGLEFLIENVLEEFNFSINRVGTDLKEVYFRNDFPYDLEDRALVYQGTDHPLGDLAKMVSYIERGYVPSVNTFIFILEDALKKGHLDKNLRDKIVVCYEREPEGCDHCGDVGCIYCSPKTFL